MLEFKCDPAFKAKVEAFAKSIGKADQLQKQFDYLEHYSCTPNDPKKTWITAWQDFSLGPYSFYLEWHRRDENGQYKLWMNGGLVYHGSDSTWSVHT